jgi:DNA repair protein RadA/Sms
MDQDVFVNAVGGVRISEPAADLAVLLAIQSSLRGKPLPQGFIAFGEVGLAGEVRPAPRGQERLKEAAKLGFTVAVIPKANAPKKPIEGMTVHAVERVDEAISLVRSLWFTRRAPEIHPKVVFAMGATQRQYSLFTQFSQESDMTLRT